jgi:NhaP-type Na+/H+ and K+/H+ antiporter
VVRDGTPTRPSGSLELRVGDRVLLLAEADDLEPLTRLFTVASETDDDDRGVARHIVGS